MEYIARGKSVEEAVLNGLKEQGWQRDEVKVEVLDAGKQGLFRRREAVVKLVKLKGETAQRNEDLNRLVEEKDGILHVNDQLFERQVMVYPPRKAIIKINDLEVTKRTILMPGDVITISGVYQGNLDEWIALSVTADGLKASIQLIESMAYHLSWKVRELEERVEIIFQEDLHNKLPFTSEDVLNWLKEKGIVYGVDQQAIINWVQEGFKTLSPVVVAAGTPKIDGQPTQFIPLYQTGETAATVADDETKVNWFGLKHVESVLAGQPILQIVPPTPGKDGQNVYGQVIKAEQGREIALHLGQGVEYSPDGSQVIATMDGRPEFASGIVSIQPVYMINGDLTLETGSIHFHGDVVVSGDVHEGLAIEAIGNVEVKGTVTQANIMAGKNISIAKSVISSQITAGGLGSIYARLREKLNIVIKQLNILISGYHQLSKLPAFNKERAHAGPGQVIKLLLETKLHDFEQHVASLEREYYESGRKEAAFVDWLRQVKQKLTGLGPLTIRKLDEVEELEAVAKKLVKEWEQYNDEECHIEAGYIHNSTVRASGNIYVRGTGVYSSTLRANHAIYVEGNPGVVRGGVLEAGKLIKVKELGVSSGVKGQVEVKDEEGKIMADRLHPGITLIINGLHYEHQKYARHVQAQYDAEQHRISVRGMM